MDSEKKRFLEATGKVIAVKRKSKNLTQKDLGEVLNVSGTTISRYESGSIDIPSSVLFKVSRECDFPMKDYLKAWNEIT